MIKAIFMDIDDTIFDFSLCVRGAFWEACAAAKITAAEETYQAFCRIDTALWDMQKAGRLTVDDVVRVRASRFTEAVNASTQAAAFQQAFQRALSAQTVFVQNASSVIRSLSGRFPLYAASNGMLDMQLSRLKSAELLLYFSDVFVSDASVHGWGVLLLPSGRSIDGWRQPTIRYRRRSKNRPEILLAEHGKEAESIRYGSRL